jgi:predicted Zn-dependent protease
MFVVSSQSFKRALVAGAALISACSISHRQEVEMGGDYAAQINRQLPMVRDAEVNRYLSVLGDSLASVADTRGLRWHFYLVDSPEVNAFAVPGGYVYINRGLIERATNMSQVAGVLAHEIAHVTERHSVQQMESQQRTSTGLTIVCVLTRICENQATQTAVQVGGGALFARFSREHEKESDLIAVKTLTKAGINPRGIPEMFRILLNERQRDPGALDGWFRTHPLEEDRIRDSDAAIRGEPGAQAARLTVDSPRFQDFKSRLAGLPRQQGRTRFR